MAEEFMSRWMKLTHQEIVARQSKQALCAKIPLSVIVHDIRSLHNVGSIFRTADGVGIEKLWLTGFSGYPPQSGIDKAALGAQHFVPWEYRQNVMEVIGQLKEKGYYIVVLEQTQGALPIDQMPLNAPVCLILGNEIEGVDQEIINQADAVLEIPMAGIKNSLNVAVAFGIAAYGIRSKLINKS